MLAFMRKLSPTWLVRRDPVRPPAGRRLCGLQASTATSSLAPRPGLSYVIKRRQPDKLNPVLISSGEFDALQESSSSSSFQQPISHRADRRNNRPRPFGCCARNWPVRESLERAARHAHGPAGIRRQDAEGRTAQEPAGVQSTPSPDKFDQTKYYARPSAPRRVMTPATYRRHPDATRCGTQHQFVGLRRLGLAGAAGIYAASVGGLFALEQRDLAYHRRRSPHASARPALPTEAETQRLRANRTPPSLTLPEFRGFISIVALQSGQGLASQKSVIGDRGRGAEAVSTSCKDSLSKPETAVGGADFRRQGRGRRPRPSPPG